MTDTSTSNMDINEPLPMIEDGLAHTVLEPPSPAYSNLTVRRAFIVWMYSGQANKFKDVCNYYHYLEALEEQLPIEERVISRHHEINMFCHPPPTSSYLKAQFPKLYSNTPIDPYFIKKLEAIKNEKCIFKLEGFNEFQQKGVTTAEIIETSQIVRNYCRTQMITLRKFHEEFRNYANRCELQETVTNVASYIKRKMITAELNIIENYPKDFSFLDSSSDKNELNGNVHEKEKVEEKIKADETDKLKSLLGLSNGSKQVLEEINLNTFHNSTVEEQQKYNSCAEFIKSYNNNAQNVRVNPYSPLTPKIEDFVRMFDNKGKSKSAENLRQGKKNIMNTLGFNQELNDENLITISELNKSR